MKPRVTLLVLGTLATTGMVIVACGGDGANDSPANPGVDGGGPLPSSDAGTTINKDATVPGTDGGTVDAAGKDDDAGRDDASDSAVDALQGTDAKADGEVPDCGRPTLSDAGTAARIVVDNAGDSNSGSCTIGSGASGACTLRAAFAAARSATTHVTIEVTVDPILSLGQIEVAPPANASEIVIALEAAGACGRRTIGRAQPNSSTAPLFRLFHVAAGATLNLNGLVIRDFEVLNDNERGGAIVNDGTLVATDTLFTKNTVMSDHVGLSTANATTLGGGAIANFGKLVIDEGTRFEDNVSGAYAHEAQFTTAYTTGGAILNAGTLTIQGSVAFVGNLARAYAKSGFHFQPGGANAYGVGGAIFNTGTLEFVGTTAAGCIFQNNAAQADTVAPPDAGAPTLTSTSKGGAIDSTVATVTLPDGGCTFTQNSATTAPDLALP